MYDSFKYCREYHQLKDKIMEFLSGGDDIDIDAMSAHIQELYDSGEMSAAQYDDLMGYIEDMM